MTAHFSDDVQYGPLPGLAAKHGIDLLVRPPTAREVHAARRTVASHAHDPADCRLLLDMLGLL